MKSTKSGGPKARKPARKAARTRTRARTRAKARDLTRTYSRGQFAAKLRRLADAIETGKAFTIQLAGESLRIPGDATFNVEHERSGADEELEFQLLWKTPRE